MRDHEKDAERIMGNEADAPRIVNEAVGGASCEIQSGGNSEEPAREREHGIHMTENVNREEKPRRDLKAAMEIEATRAPSPSEDQSGNYLEAHRENEQRFNDWRSIDGAARFHHGSMRGLAAPGKKMVRQVECHISEQDQC